MDGALVDVGLAHAGHVVMHGIGMHAFPWGEGLFSFHHVNVKTKKRKILRRNFANSK